MTHEEMLEEAARREFEEMYGDALEEIATTHSENK